MRLHDDRQGRSAALVFLSVMGALVLGEGVLAQDLTATFTDKLVLTSGDGNTSIRIGGRIHNDWAWISGDNDAEASIGDPFEDGNEFRRARLYVSGHIHRWLIFKAQYDFEDGEADFKDVYAGIRGLPGVGTFRAGQFKEPFSLEQLTSSNDITLMERSNADSFTPARNTGFMVDNCVLEERVTFAVGVFRDTDGFGDSQGDGEYNYTGRVTFLPVYEDGGEFLVHTGAAASFRKPNDDTVSYDDNREVHLAPTTADTDRSVVPINDVEDVKLLGIEAAAVWGPVSVQGEYNMSRVDGPAGLDPDFSGWYVMASWIVTGEHRRYKTRHGVFANPKPKENFDPGNGTWGAVELVGRFSNLDLTDGPIDGGEVDSLAGGVNWYLNPNARLMFNYVHSEYDEGIDGDSDAFQMRFQFNF